MIKIYYCDHYVIPLPDWHRFPMRKYARLRERIEREGFVKPDCLVVPHAATSQELLRVHEPDYVLKVLHGTLSRAEETRIGFPWSPELAERSRRSSGATIEAARHALTSRSCGINLAGGTHHAYPDHGEGYCLFNDVAVASRAMLAEGRIARAAVVDADVHQGNGTAAIFAKDPRVFTFSIHGARNYPLHKPPSDLDVALPDGTDDDGYLEPFARALNHVLDHVRPDLILFIAGADPYQGDRLGRMKLTKQGLGERDRLVIHGCHRRRIPLAIVMAGGYAPDVEDIVEIHFNTVREAVRTFSDLPGINPSVASF